MNKDKLNVPEIGRLQIIERPTKAALDMVTTRLVEELRHRCSLETIERYIRAIDVLANA